MNKWTAGKNNLPAKETRTEHVFSNPRDQGKEYGDCSLPRKPSSAKPAGRQTELVPGSPKFIQTAQKGLQSELLKKYYPLVVSAASRFQAPGSGWETCDLIQEGQIALLKSIDRFDSRRGTEFKEFASKLINNAMSNYVAAHSSSLHVTSHAQRVMKRLSRSRERLKNELGRNASSLEITKDAGISKESIDEYRILEARLNTVSFDHPDDDENGFTSDSLVSRFAEPLFQLVDKERSEQIEIAISQLTKNERRVIRSRYLVDVEQQLTLEQLASRLSISKSGVRYIETKALQKLRQSLSLMD